VGHDSFVFVRKLRHHFVTPAPFISLRIQPRSKHPAEEDGFIPPGSAITMTSGSPASTSMAVTGPRSTAPCASSLLARSQLRLDFKYFIQQDKKRKDQNPSWNQGMGLEIEVNYHHQD